MSAALKDAKRALEIALLETLVAEPYPVTVSLYPEGSPLQLSLTAEDIARAAQRQLEDLKAAGNCDGSRMTLEGAIKRCHLQAGHEGAHDDGQGRRWW